MEKLFWIFSLSLLCATGQLKGVTDNQDIIKGLELLKLHEYEKAIEAFNVLLKENANNPFLWERRGYAYYCLENYYQSINDFTLSIILAPSNSLFLLQRALAYNATGNINAMKNDLIHAAKIGNPQAQELLKNHNIEW